MVNKVYTFVELDLQVQQPPCQTLFYGKAALVLVLMYYFCHRIAYWLESMSHLRHNAVAAVAKIMATV
jgi:hypothetical protein